MRKLLLGDEAIAQAAIDAGLSGVYAYPGTPSTEITEFIQLREEKRGDAENKICCRWATNEKTAMEGALGMSYMGKRALVCMKHVGMNVAADPFVNSAMTGVNGGLVVVAADDPSMHSSQNEQDSRFYGKFAMMPIFEPSNQQEAYEMTRAAFELSEAVKLPVLMRVTTRMAHSRAVVEVAEAPRKQNDIKRPEDVRTWILLPAFAKKRYVQLLKQQDDLMKAAVESKFNHYRKGTNPERGVIATGIAYNYYMENCANCDERSVLKVSQYPLPVALIEKMVEDGAKEILVMEEGQPVVEEMVRAIVPSTVKVLGRLTGDLPRVGELNPDSVRKSLGMAALENLEAVNADEKTGVAIVKRAIEEPLRQIVANAGKEGAVVVQKVREGNGDYGYNARTEVYENLFAAGVVDPAKVTRVALENAASIAGMFLTTECVIVEKKEDKPEMPMGAPGMGGMGGMM